MTEYNTLREGARSLLMVLAKNKAVGGSSIINPVEQATLERLLFQIDAMIDESGDSEQSDTISAQFMPQAWVNGYAVDVDVEPGQETVWFIAAGNEKFVEAAIYNDDDLDFLKADPFAPQWVRDYPGPFEIQVLQ
jgi:hypothetical protein